MDASMIENSGNKITQTIYRLQKCTGIVST